VKQERFCLNLIGKIFTSIKNCHFIAKLRTFLKDYKGPFGFKCQVYVIIFYKISVLFLRLFLMKI